jgi:hypothetical protein
VGSTEHQEVFMKSKSAGVLFSITLATILWTGSDPATSTPIVIDVPSYRASLDTWQQSNAERAKAMMDRDYEAWQRGEKMRAAGCVLTQEESLEAIKSYMSSNNRFLPYGLTMHSARFLRAKPACAGFF